MADLVEKDLDQMETVADTPKTTEERGLDVDSTGGPHQCATKPLMITIGPPLCGKTTYIQKYKNEQEKGLQNFSFSDFEGVYCKAPIFWVRNGLRDYNTWNYKVQGFRNIRTHGKWIHEIILEQCHGEQITMMLLLGGEITLDVALMKLRIAWGMNDLQQQPLVNALLDMIMQELYSGTLALQTQTIDIYVSEALTFAAFTTTGNLKDFCKKNPNTAAAFGNTNTSDLALRKALEVAEEVDRRVEFARYGIEIEGGPDGRPVDIVELYRRNLRRFAAVGRFIPISSITHHLKLAREILFVDQGPDQPPRPATLEEICGSFSFEYSSETGKVKCLTPGEGRGIRRHFLKGDREKGERGDNREHRAGGRGSRGRGMRKLPPHGQHHNSPDYYHQQELHIYPPMTPYGEQQPMPKM